MLLPLLMGAAPLPPIQLCFDCGAYFWLGIGLGIVGSIVLVLIAHHVFRR